MILGWYLNHAKSLLKHAPECTKHILNLSYQFPFNSKWQTLSPKSRGNNMIIGPSRRTALIQMRLPWVNNTLILLLLLLLVLCLLLFVIIIVIMINCVAWKWRIFTPYVVRYIWLDYTNFGLPSGQIRYDKCMHIAA